MATEIQQHDSTEQIAALEQIVAHQNDIIEAYRAEVDSLGWRTLTGLQSRIGAWAKEKGWLDQERSFGDEIALMHSELSEALEEVRAGRGITPVYRADPQAPGEYLSLDLTDDRERIAELEAQGFHLKPEGAFVELADTVIRILQSAAAHHVDFERILLDKLAYNDHRPYRHGGKAL